MLDNKKIIAVIPARGGSKRFPGKNTHPLNGRPLISYPIEAAKKAKLVDRIIVSTDDEKIAEVAREYGAEVPFMRPTELAGDISLVIDAIAYTVKKLAADENYYADYAVLLQPTTPIINPEHIDQAIKLAIEKDADSVITASEVDTINHPYNVREITEDGMINFWQDKIHYEYKRSGKPRPKFYKATNLWLTSFKTLVEDKLLEGKKNYPIVVEHFYSFDIDYQEDLEFIELWLKKQETTKLAKTKLG